jgi:hypothetical protein
VVATGAVTVVGFVTAAIMGVEKASAQNSANTVAQSITTYYQGQHPGADPSGVCYNVSPSSTPYGPGCAALASDDNNVNADATLANIGIAVGVVGAVGVVITTIFAVNSYGHAAENASSPLTVTPLVGHGVGGMMLGGAF